MGNQSKQKAKHDHARRPKPGQFSKTVNRCDTQDIEGYGPAEKEILVIPSVNRLTIAACEMRRLQREFQHAHVRADRRQINVKRFQNTARRCLQVVESLADRRISNGHRRRVSRQ